MYKLLDDICVILSMPIRKNGSWYYSKILLKLQSGIHIWFLIKRQKKGEEKRWKIKKGRIFKIWANKCE